MSGKQPPRRPGDPTVEKARDISRRNGLPFVTALEVARGKIRLADAVQRLLRRQRAMNIARTYRLPLSVSGNVAANKVSLRRALLLERLRAQLGAHLNRSCLDLSLREGVSLVLFAHGRRIEGIVAGNEPFDVLVRSASGAVERVRKIEFKFACRAADAPAVAGAVTTDPAVRALGLGPIEDVRRRHHLKNEFLQILLDERAPFSITTLEGDVLHGRLSWFGRWELGFLLDAGPEVFVFRHAVHSVLTDRKRDAVAGAKG